MSETQRRREMRRDFDDVRSGEENVTSKVLARPVGKQPLTVFRVNIDGVLVLPTKFNSGGHSVKASLSRLGSPSAMCCTQVPVKKKDDDLDRLVFKFYDEKVDTATYKAANYVSTDTATARRSVLIIYMLRVRP